jgi:flagellar assembly protein FliH
MMSTSYKSLFPAAPPPVESFPYPEAQTGLPISQPQPRDANDEIGELLLRAHAEGVREGETKERARVQELVEGERAKITETILQFQTSVSEYFSRTEAEVVQLSLAIAAKILQREAQADPMLIGKLAKSVLDGLHHNTKVKVRVAPDEKKEWREALAAHHDAETALEVVADTSVQPQGCVLETELGSTEIGIDAQLRELESGLFDLMAESPRKR